jgi:hypothetical protein
LLLKRGSFELAAASSHSLTFAAFRKIPAATLEGIVRKEVAHRRAILRGGLRLDQRSAPTTDLHRLSAVGFLTHIGTLLLSGLLATYGTLLAEGLLSCVGTLQSYGFLCCSGTLTHSGFLSLGGTR